MTRARIALVLLTVLAAPSLSAEETRNKGARLPKKPPPVAAKAEDEVRLYAGAVCDLHADKQPLLVVGGFEIRDGARSALVAAYQQQKNGRFRVLYTSRASDGRDLTIRDLAAVDLDGDSQDEIVVVGHAATPKGDEGVLSVLGLREDELVTVAQARWKSAKGGHTMSLDIGNLDGDGKPELVTAGYFSDGKRERGEVRLWKFRGNAAELIGRADLDDKVATSVRLAAVALGDLDGDGKREIVAAGRLGTLDPAHPDDPGAHPERPFVIALSYDGSKLVERSRYSWERGSTGRLRALRAADLDGDGHAEIVVAGQYDPVSKPYVAVVRLAGGNLFLAADADWGGKDQQGEIKDLMILERGGKKKIIAAGALGPADKRHGEIEIFRYGEGKLGLELSRISMAGEDTQARALVPWPTAKGPQLITVGQAKTKEAIIGQLLDLNAP